MKIDPAEFVDLVHDLPGLLAFIECLREDWVESQNMEIQEPSSLHGVNHLGWENTTIDGFLESVVAWAKDSKLNDQGLNAYQSFARMLLAGKMYE